MFNIYHIYKLLKTNFKQLPTCPNTKSTLDANTSIFQGSITNSLKSHAS